MSEAGNWCLIESDPGVFTELVQKFGVSGVQVMYAKNREYGTNMRTWYWKSESGESELLGGRAVEFGQRAVYRSQTCVRVCNVLSTFANCTPTVMFYPQCNSIDLMQALRFSFPKFQASFYIQIQILQLFCNYYGVSGQFISDFFLTLVFIWLLTLRR